MDHGMHRHLDGLSPHSRYYRCRDGQWVSLNAIQPKHWDAFCEVVDRAEWKERREDKTLVAEVEKLFLDAPSTYWEALAANREICLFRVIPWGDHITFSQARPQLATDPFTWAGFGPNPSLTPAPILGQDTFAVMHSMGLSHKEIGDWLQSGIAFQAEPGPKK
jgi:crotonobetainyl-CoA:carnitine CoA-transferase CaiB-like acyl-CoA transferase